MAAPVVVILAAGKGTRMRSSIPKLAHPMCGRPLIRWPIEAARAAEAARIIVVDAPGTPLAEHLDPDITVATQDFQLGTGDAARAAISQIAADDTVVIINGDVPLIRHETITALAVAHQAGSAQATILTSVLEDPTGWGRVVRDTDGNVTKVVETRKPGDASPEEMLIDEVNSGVYAFSGATLASALAELSNENAQGEYYLTDVLGILHGQGHRVGGHQLGDPVEMFNINDRVQLARATEEAQQRINHEHMLAGVTIVNPASTVIDADVELAEDVVIEPGCVLRGPSQVASGAVIGPHSTLISAEVGERSRVIHAYVELAVIGREVSVGPFAYLRPGTTMHDRSKAGTFVEIKNSQVGEGSKVPHLSYIGDADIGTNTNLGASTITANYDGTHKHRTTIGSDVHSSVHVSFTAPVTVGDRAWTGAGSVITEDIPEGALGIARERQTNKPGYDDRKKSAN